MGKGLKFPTGYEGLYSNFSLQELCIGNIKVLKIYPQEGQKEGF